MSNHPACQPISDTEFHVLRITVQEVERKFMVKLHIVLQMPFTREVNISGPQRDTRSESVLDGMELGKRYVVEGEAGAKSVALKLRKKRWAPTERARADETLLLQFVLPGRQGNQALMPLEEKQQPIGEGWVRYNDDMLFHPLGHIYFAQSGERAGRYLKKRFVEGEWDEVQSPHASQELPLSVRMASAACLKHGAKLERAVLLNDITRIARLACKIPLSYVDRPACAFALFQGHRNSEAAQWCAENAHKKLLPRLAEKVHSQSDASLEDVLRQTLVELDAELLASAFAFSGCSALLALLVGDRLVTAGVGQVRACVLTDDGKVEPLLNGGGGLSDDGEFQRLRAAGGIVRDGRLRAQTECADDVERILSAKSVFHVLSVDSADALDEKQARSAYRRMALRVHPDKQGPELAGSENFKAAFARLESAKDALERMLAEDVSSCRELHQVLRSDVHTRAGAAQLLGVEAETLAAEAEKASRILMKKLERMQVVAPDHELAVLTCSEAVETLRRPCSPEALHRYEALLHEGVEVARAMGLRDLRRPRPIVVMEPASATWRIPLDRHCRVALLCGTTAARADELLVKHSAYHSRRPKASALRWCLDVLEGDASVASSMAGCIVLGPAREEAAPPPSKRARTSSSSSDGTLRVRHILFRHQQLKVADPMARREGSARTAQEAEEAALRALERLQGDPTQFPKFCRELSDCQTAAQAGALSGDFGWIARGQLEPTLEEVVFALGINEFSDIVSSCRGVHIFQRLG